MGSNLIRDIVGNLARGAVECWDTAVETTAIGVRGLASRSSDEEWANFVDGLVTNVGRDEGLGMIGFSLGIVEAALVSTVEAESIPLPPTGKEEKTFLNWDRQIWLTMFISLLPNSQLWIVQMVRYYCFGLQKSATEQK